MRIRRPNRRFRIARHRPLASTGEAEAAPTRVTATFLPGRTPLRNRCSLTWSGRLKSRDRGDVNMKPTRSFLPSIQIFWREANRVLVALTLLVLTACSGAVESEPIAKDPEAADAS